MQTTAVPTLRWSLHVLLPVEEHVSALLALVATSSPSVWPWWEKHGWHCPWAGGDLWGGGGGPLSTWSGIKGLTHRTPFTRTCTSPSMPFFVFIFLKLDDNYSTCTKKPNLLFLHRFFLPFPAILLVLATLASSTPHCTDAATFSRSHWKLMFLLGYYR